MRFAWIEEPPFNTRTPSGLSGSDVELACRLAQEIGESFDPVETSFARLLPGLREGQWEMTTGLFVTPDRAALVRFTRPIWRLSDGLLLRAALAGGIGGYRDLAARGLRVAVLEGQVQHRAALELGVAPSRIAVFEAYAEAAEAVRTGAVDAYASVAHAHDVHLRRHPDGGLICIRVPESERPAALGAFACAEPGFRDRVDAALGRLLGSPWHRALLEGHGLGSCLLDG